MESEWVHNVNTVLIKRLSLISCNDMISTSCAGHIHDDGYEYFNDRTLVTVFTAPNYCGEHDNYGAVLSVSDELCCSFELLLSRDLTEVKHQMKRMFQLNTPKPTRDWDSSECYSLGTRD